MPTVFDSVFAAVLRDAGGQVFNIKHPDFGAAGDGSTDDTTALSDALDAAIAVDGVVFVPDGVFNHTPITKTARPRIIGTGPSSILRNTSNVGGVGLTFANAAAALDQWFIGHISLCSEAGAGDVLDLHCCHRGKMDNVVIPSSGARGVILNGCIGNLFSAAHVTTNHPYPIGTRSAPTYGYVAQSGSAGPCSGNGSNANKWECCMVEGITSGDGIGYLLDSDGNQIMGGASEGNKVGVRLGVGVHNNIIMTYMEANSITDIDPLDGDLGLNSVFPAPGAGNGALNVPRILFGDGTQSAPGMAFRDDSQLGFFRLGTDEFIAVANNGRIVGFSPNGVELFTTFYPDLTANNRDLGTSAKEWHDLYLSGVMKIDGTQVVRERVTGWGAASGTATRTTFNTATVTTAQLAERVKALLDDLQTHGLIGN